MRLATFSGGEVVTSSVLPEDRPVPPFLSGNLWEFTGRVPDQGRTLPAAMASTSFVLSSGRRR